jgi:PAS domain S-box-containing protein
MVLTDVLTALACVLIAVAVAIYWRRGADERARGGAGRAEFNERVLAESSQAILAYKASGACVLANKAAARVVGAPVERLLAQNFRELASWRANGMLDAAERALATGETQHICSHSVSTFGRAFWIDADVSTFTSGGEPYLLWACQDVTSRHDAEERLERKRVFIRSVVDALPGIFYVIDTEGRFELWNRNMETITGYTAAEVARLHAVDLFAGDERDLIARKMTEVFCDGEAETEASLITRNRKAIPYCFSGKRLDGADGVKLIGMGLDLSARHTMEEALRRSNQDLESFAYVASHDLQEPLRAVSNYLQLLKRHLGGRGDADTDEYIGFAVDGAGRMQRLIKDLLTLSRVTTSGHSFAPTPLDEVVAEAQDNLRATIDDCGATVTCDPLPCLPVDRLQMVSLFQNLMGNAIKYRKPAEPPSVVIGAAREGGEWRFFVRDNGIGIAPEYYARIFVIFQRLHGRGEYEGTGIGLAICKKIVERHNGRIWLKSQPGEGSTFQFTLPA